MEKLNLTGRERGPLENKKLKLLVTQSMACSFGVALQHDMNALAYD